MASGTPLTAAVEYYLRKTHREQPRGKRDRAGRWYPYTEEAAPCCGAIRNPSRRWPNTLLRHAMTKKHVAARYGVTVRQINSLLPYVESMYG